jgi:hypothetical protein
MQLTDIERMCDRAAKHVFEKKKLALTSLILAALGGCTHCICNGALSCR